MGATKEYPVSIITASRRGTGVITTSVSPWAGSRRSGRYKVPRGHDSSQKDPIPALPTGTRRLERTGCTSVQILVTAQEVLGLVRPHTHLRVSGMPEELAFRRFDGKDVVGQQRESGVHHRDGAGALAAATGGQEGHTPTVHLDGGGVQRRHVPQLQPAREGYP